MNWHNGKEWNAFRRRAARQAEEYRALGMTEEQIRELYRFDLEVFRSDRRFYRHTETLESYYDDESWEEALNRLFPVAVLVEPEEPGQGEEDWLEGIEDPALHRWLTALPGEALALLTMLAFRDYTQAEAAKVLRCTPQNVSQAVARLRAKWPKKKVEGEG